MRKHLPGATHRKKLSLYRSWNQAASITKAPRPAVFIDRDGTMVEEVNYLHKVADLRIIDGALEAIHELNRRGILVIEITNQRGIGLGHYKWRNFHAVQSALEKRLAEAGGWLDGVWACSATEAEHPYRKPNPGMLVDAAEALHLDLRQSWMIGDNITDILAAAKAEMTGAVLVQTGHGTKNEPELKQLSSWTGNVAVAPDLSRAVGLILQHIG